jgi:hypothetical protein
MNGRKATESVGQTYGRLTVLGIERGPVGNQGQKATFAFCKCECGSTSRQCLNNLRSGQAISCGCGRTESHTTHGLYAAHPREYKIWKGMIQRTCNPADPSAEFYWLEGIRCAPEWTGPEGLKKFIQDMGPIPGGKRGGPDAHSLDRIDGDGPYAPWNCRWATKREQDLNRCSTHWITFQGKTLCLTDWAKEIGMGLDTLWNRLNSGWSAEKSLIAPVDTWHSPTQITFQGRTQGRSAWERERGMRPGLLKERLNRYGWSVEKALTTPVQVHHHHSQKQA